VRIGIDLGGTKIEGIALDTRGDVLHRTRKPAPRGDYDASVRAIVDLVHELERVTGTHGSVGVGIPGTIATANGLVKNANSTWLNGRPFGADIEACLKRPVRFANDANCFALSEATDGAGAGAHCVFGVIIGTGTGGGIAIGGQVLTGVNAVAGEWGHNPLPWMREGEWPGRECYCGRQGCIETFLSGPALSAAFAAATGSSFDAVTIAERAVDGDEAARHCLDQYEDRLARALATVINVLDPDVIVLGGGLSNITQLYESVPRRWGAYVFSDRVVTGLRRAQHGDASGVRGAAWLW
jgi:fructokinase